MKFYVDCDAVSSVIIQKMAFKAGYEWFASKSVLQDYSFDTEIFFDSENKDCLRGTIHKVIVRKQDCKEYTKITLEQLVDYFLEGKITWDQPYEVQIGGHKVSVNKDGTIKFGCTLLTKEQVDNLIGERTKLTS